MQIGGFGAASHSALIQQMSQQPRVAAQQAHATANQSVDNDSSGPDAQDLQKGQHINILG